MINSTLLIMFKNKYKILKSLAVLHTFSNQSHFAYEMLFSGCFGQDSFRRYNLHYLDNDTIIQASGVTMQILNLKTNER